MVLAEIWRGGYSVSDDPLHGYEIRVAANPYQLIGYGGSVWHHLFSNGPAPPRWAFCISVRQATGHTAHSSTEIIPPRQDWTAIRLQVQDRIDPCA